jgi:23S rRNA (adenine2503-C2)-methyltransferase
MRATATVPTTTPFVKKCAAASRSASSSVSFGRCVTRARRVGVRASDDDNDEESFDDGDGPTFVPRAPGVSDGPWAKADTRAVVESIRDADATARKVFQLTEEEPFNLLGLTAKELKEFAAGRGMPAFRGKQMADHLYAANGASARSVNDFTTLSKKLREELKNSNIRVGRSRRHHVAAAPDGTAKLLLRLDDDRVVETVGIPATENGKNRLTACVSSQVGCPMRCTFCATGKGGFARNLAPHEIVDQVLALEEYFGQRVSNVVFMGMGEPLLNVPNVLKAHEVLNKEIGIGARHITISTVGVRGSIEKLAQAQLQSVLAVSLHAPNQALRETIIPSAKVYPMEDLLQDCEQYFIATGRRVTFEYTLLGGVNDQPEHAKELGRLLYARNLASHVNLIPYNPVDDSDFKRPSRATVYAFRDVLEDLNVPASIRQTRGLEAAAACGQLRNAFQKDAIKGDLAPATA